MHNTPTLQYLESTCSSSSPLLYAARQSLSILSSVVKRTDFLNSLRSASHVRSRT